MLARAGSRWLPLALLISGLFSATAAEAQQIRGRVLDDATGAMLAPALVTLRLEGADSVAARVVAESGAFELTLAQGGLYSIRVELFGYHSTTGMVEIRQGSVITVELRLRPDAIPLQPLRVVGERREPWWMADIRDRHRRGFGTFLFREDLDRRWDSQLEHVLTDAGGIFIDHILLPGGARRHVPMVVMRRSAASGADVCYAHFYLNGHPIFIRDKPDHDDLENILQVMDYRPADIEAIEIYRGPGSTPAEYAAFSSGHCGVVAVWLRTDVNSQEHSLVGVPMPRVRLSATGGSRSLAGRDAPANATALTLASSWQLSEGLAISALLSTGHHVMSAETSWELTLPLVQRNMGSRGFIVPSGPRPLRVTVLSIGPSYELVRHRRYDLSLGIDAAVAQRSFTVKNRYHNRSDARFSSLGLGAGASSAARLHLNSSASLEIQSAYQRLHFLPYSEYLDGARATGRTWSATGFRAGVSLHLGPER
jgi:hypothetical protein